MMMKRLTKSSLHHILSVLNLYVQLYISYFFSLSQSLFHAGHGGLPGAVLPS